MMHHYPHHIGDYAAATAHLTFVEDGAYSRLLRLYYRDEQPLPADVVACQRLTGARTREERAAVETVLREFFSLENDGWHQARADEEVAAYQARAEIARVNGKKSGGRPKTGREPKGKPADNPAGNPRVTQTITQTEPSRTLTENRKPGTSNQGREEVEGARAPDMPIAHAVDVWNEAAERAGWPKVQQLTEPRRKALKARLSECGGIDGWMAAIAKAEASSFLTGRSGRTGEHANWRCGIDFILRQAAFTKLMEGGFDDRPGTPNDNQSSHERQREALAEWSREGDR